MMSNNFSVFVGRLTRDAKITEKEGKFQALISLCTETTYDREKKEMRVAFVPIAAYGLPKFKADALKKGVMISIVGAQVSSIKSGEGEDAQFRINITCWGNQLQVFAPRTDSPSEGSSEPSESAESLSDW